MLLSETLQVAGQVQAPDRVPGLLARIRVPLNEEYAATLIEERAIVTDRNPSEWIGHEICPFPPAMYPTSVAQVSSAWGAVGVACGGLPGGVGAD